MLSINIMPRMLRKNGSIRGFFCLQTPCGTCLNGLYAV